MCLVAGPSQDLELAVNRRGVARLLLYFQGGEELEVHQHLHSAGGMLPGQLRELPSTGVLSQPGQTQAEQDMEVLGCVSGLL